MDRKAKTDIDLEETKLCPALDGDITSMETSANGRLPLCRAVMESLSVQGSQRFAERSSRVSTGDQYSWRKQSTVQQKLLMPLWTTYRNPPNL